MVYDTSPSFAKAYEKYFKIGAAVVSRDFASASPLIKKHFNCLSPNFDMKWEPIEPYDGVFTWEKADEIAVFARENKMALRAHAPVWHIQNGKWVFVDGDRPASRELLIERMDRHTRAFAERYRDDIFAWDVVNEAIEDTGPEILRRTQWYDGIGEDYLDIAFTQARKYAPNVQLFYNDYNEWVPEKRAKIIKLIRGMQERGVPIDGFGLQSHIRGVFGFPMDEYKRSIEEFAALGVRLHITELDISLYDYDERSMPPAPLTDELFVRQAQLYKDLFEVYRYYADVIDDVTFWGVADYLSWIDGYFFKNKRTCYPLPFYYDHTPKPFTKEIIEAALLGK